MHQNTVESSMFDSEFIAMNATIDQIQSTVCPWTVKQMYSETMNLSLKILHYLNPH